MNNKDRWSALSMQQRADLIKLYIDNGINSIKEMRKDYNGIPYRDFNTSEYDYFNAHPSNAPTKEEEHWTSRNPKTGQLLKREDHPTFDLMIEGEKQAGYNVVKGLDGNLYSIPNTPNNYVEDYNSFGDGGYTNHPIEVQQDLKNGTIKAIKREDGTYTYIKQEVPLKDTTSEIMEWTPVVGDVYEAGQVVNDIKDKNYGSAVLGAGLMLIPGNLGKIKTLFRNKKVKKAVSEIDPHKVQDYINSVDNDVFDVTDYTHLDKAIPEYAFTPSKNPLEDIHLTPTSTTKQKEKFVRDVQQASKYQRTSPQTHQKVLTEFDESIPLDELMGVGMENVVYGLGDNVIKIPTNSMARLKRHPAGNVVWDYGVGNESLEEMIKDANAYLEDFNKYWFQEPLSLVGYQKRTVGNNGKEVFVPVFSQRKASGTYNEVINNHLSKYDDVTKKNLEQDLEELQNIHQNNIFSENDLPVPYDMHFGNLAIYPEGLRAIDIHKDGGKLNKFATGGPTEEVLNSNTNEPLITREEYLNKQRQNIITQSIENSNNRIQPAVPYIEKYKDQTDWEFQINDRRQSLLNLIDEATKFNWGEEHVNAYKSDLKDLEDEYNKGYRQESIPGATCIYTATDNYGKKYKVAGNKSFRSSPEKYGFTEINLNDIKPGDIIQDFSVNGTPTHALTFMGYSDEGKAMFNYSSGDYTEKAIKKNKNYPFYSEYGDPLFLNNEDNTDLRTYAAAYRFIGTQEDNDMWNSTYNQLRKNYAQNITNELKNVPSSIKGKAIQLNKTKLLTK